MIMSASGFSIFETAIGTCGIAWGERGLLATQLPDRSANETRARLTRRRPDLPEASPPDHVQDAMERIASHLRGEPADLSNIPLDMNGLAPLNRKVYEIARRIPSGATRTYGEIADEIGQTIGDPGDARAVGQALGQNPFPIVIPCHRVLAAGGKAGGFSAPGSIVTKFRLLEIEGARIEDTKAAGTPTLFDIPLSVAPPRRRG